MIDRGVAASFLLVVQRVLGYFFLYPIVVAGIGFFGTQLRKRHPGDINTLWYAFSLTIVLTTEIALWAAFAGHIDHHGNPRDHVGAFIQVLLEHAIDVQSEILLFVGIAAIVLLPQFLAYLLSGLFFGVAGAPIFVNFMFTFFVWGVAKALVSLAGIIVVVLIIGALQGWAGTTPDKILFIMFGAALCVLAAFVCLSLYRDVLFVSKGDGTTRPTALGRALHRLHRRFTRYSADRFDTQAASKVNEFRVRLERILAAWLDDPTILSTNEARILDSLSSHLDRPDRKGWEWLLKHADRVADMVRVTPSRQSPEFAKFWTDWDTFCVRERVRRGRKA